MKNGLYQQSNVRNGDYFLIHQRNVVVFPYDNFSISSEEEAEQIDPWSDYIEVRGEKETLPPLTPVIDIDDWQCVELMEKVDALGFSNATAIFNLTANEIRLLKDEIVRINASYLRIYSQDNDIRVSLFDIQEFGIAYRFIRKTSSHIRYFDTTGSIYEPFSFTMFASTFEKLGVDDIDFRVGDNNVLSATQITRKNARVFYIRDQNIVEPVNLFYSPKTDCHISFVFHPKS